MFWTRKGSRHRAVWLLLLTLADLLGSGVYLFNYDRTTFGMFLLAVVIAGFLGLLGRATNSVWDVSRSTFCTLRFMIQVRLQRPLPREAA